MNKSVPVAVLAAALLAPLLAPAAALAQEPDAPVAAPPAPVVAQPSGVTVTIPPCRLAEHAGIDEADAATAGQLVCAEIMHAGALQGSRYRVSLGKLGSVVILSVAREGDTLGSTVESREVRLQGVEEVAVAAPRIADSIVHGTPMRETEKVDNLVGEETRQPKSKPGKVHFGIGLLGMTPPLDRGLGPAPGGILDLHYETGSGTFEIGGSLRFGAGQTSQDSPQMGFFLFSIGGRYFTSDTDFSPYVGGGLSWGYLQLKVPDEGFDGDNSGLGAFVDAGLEIMRTHRTHLSLGARLDLPFFALNNHGVGIYNATTGTTTAAGANNLYYAPLSLEMRLTF
ncbi:MAG TPA: hypothetical protein VIF15_03845 [Polyangiaceae bacterium]